MTIDIQAVAEEVFSALRAGQQIKSFTARMPSFNVDDAYRVAAAVRQLRESSGEQPVGRKIGFTNRTIWAEYDVYALIWGFVYDRTAHDLAEIDGRFSLASLIEPRIEPEIVFKLAAAPAAGMDDRALLRNIDWVAHGFELVQSMFPNWKFSTADTVAAFGLHGALLIGPHYPVKTELDQWERTLRSFEIDLKRGDEVVDHGRATNVLEGPVSALRHVIDVLAHDVSNPPLAAGEIITTGTLTRPFPVVAGESWSTVLTGISVDPISVIFA